VADQHEERIAGRVRDAEHLGRRHVLASVPHRDRWRERHQIEYEYEARRYRGGDV